MPPQPTDGGGSGGGCFKLVLTGGPCGDKSSCIAQLKKKLERQGFQVLIVNETATHVLECCGGFDPAWAGTPKAAEFQRMILKDQLSSEDIFQTVAALRSPKPAVMICDRGACVAVDETVIMLHHPSSAFIR